MKRANPCHLARRVLVPCIVVSAFLPALVGCGSGALSNSVRQEIGAQVLQQRRPMTACYKRALRRNRALGKTDLVLAFTVDPASGAFRDVNMQGGSGCQDPQLQQCLVQLAQGLSVARAPDKPVVVNYPLSFSIRRR